MTLKNSLSNNEDFNNEELRNKPEQTQEVWQPGALVGGISLFRLTAKIIKRHIWLPLLALLGFVLNMPLLTALVWSNLPWLGDDRRYVLENYAEEIQAVFNVGSMCIIIVGAVLAAFVLFRYLHARRQVDFYHSLPIRREKFFVANILAGLLVFVVPYLAAHLLALPLLAGSGLLAYINMAAYAQALLFNILGYAVMFALAVLAMLLSGNLAGSIKVLISTYALCPVLGGLIVVLSEAFYSSYWGPGVITEVLIKLSVIERYVILACGISDGSLTVLWQDWLCGGVIALAALAAAMFLYKRRNSECAGSTLAFRLQKPFFKYPYVVIAALFGAVMFYFAGDQSFIWMGFGLVLVTLLISQIMEIFITLDFRAVKRGLKGAAACLLVAAVLLGVWVGDLTGFDKWQAQADNVEAIYVRASTFGHVFDDSYYRRDEGDRYYQSGWLMDSYKSTVRVDDPAAIAAILQIVQSEPVEYGDYYGNEYGGYYDYSDSVYEPVRYELKNGTVKLRSTIHGGVYQNFDAYLALYDSQTMRAQMMESLLPQEGRMVFLNDMYDYSVPEPRDIEPMSGSAERGDGKPGEELLAAYVEEFMAMPSERLLKGATIAEVNLRAYTGYQHFAGGGYDFDEAWYYTLMVYPEMTKTIALLDKYFGTELNQNKPDAGYYTLTSVDEYLVKDATLPIATDDVPMEFNPPQELLEQQLEAAQVTAVEGGPVDTEVDKPLVETDAWYEREDGWYKYIGGKWVRMDESYDEMYNFIVRHLDVSADAVEIAGLYDKTVSENMLRSNEYYRPYIQCGRLSHYEFTYMTEGGYTVEDTRYILPAGI